MSKLKEQELLAQLDYWGGECRKHAEEHDYSCEIGCPHQQRCEQAHQQIRKRIQKDEQLMEQKARELHQQVYGDLIKCDYKCAMMKNFREIIRSLYEEE